MRTKQELGYLMAEIHDLDVGKESYPKLLMLTEWLVIQSRVLLTCSSWSPQKTKQQL
jgi:hypothetical protein